MDFSSLAPNWSNVLNPDTMKVAGLLMALLTGKWVLGKAWGLTKTAGVAAGKSLSLIGVLSGLMLLTGIGGVGFGIGQINKPKQPFAPTSTVPSVQTKLVSYADTLNTRKFDTEKEYNEAWEERNKDYKSLSADDFAKKWGKPIEAQEIVQVPTLSEPSPIIAEQQNSYVMGWSAVGIGLGTLIVGASAFLKKYG